MLRTTLFVMLSFVVLQAASAQTAPFPFVIPWDDSQPTLTDVSFLNRGPAGSHGFIISRGGHFVESEGGRRIRFVATNFAAAAAFPSHADAEKVAARLAKYGVNLVRFHHMDNDWGQKQSIIDYAYKDHQHLNAGQLDRLDYLIAQLKKHGIYANLNLHVSRTFGPADGFPATVSDIKFSYDKRVDYFDRRMIELEKKYAHDLLTHVNPYTGLSYCNEPAVLNTELTNEDSLVGDPWAGQGKDLASLPEPFLSELRGQWNEWLRHKYRSTDLLKTAWEGKTTPPGPSILRPTAEASSWTVEHQGETAASIAPDGDALRVSVTKIDATPWHVQLHQTGLNVREGATYTVTFRARASAPRSMGVYVGLDQADWHHVGLTSNADLTPQWKTYHFAFTAENTVPDHARLSFSLGNTAAEVWLQDVQLRPGGDLISFEPGETLEAATIAVPADSQGAQQVDWLSFLTATERSYADEMRRYLKDTLHFKPMVICSQISWSGAGGPYREAGMDFADNHAYWQHPSFPGKPWDPVDWKIGNTSMIPVLGKSDELTRLASERLGYKPYTISEYNHPAPSDYQAECVPLLASFAAFQDWDAFYLFDYGDYGTGAANDKIQGFFAVNSNPAKWAFVPAAALMFRAGEIPTAARADIFNAPIDLKDLFSRAGAAKIQQAKAQARQQALTSKVDLNYSDYLVLASDKTAASAPPVLKVSSAAGQEDYTAVGPASAVVAGFIGGRTVDVGPARLTVGEVPNRYAVITVNSRDLKPLPNSASILITAVDRVENTGMEWNTAHDSVGNHWGTAPSVADGVPLTISIAVDGPRRVEALNSVGKPDHTVVSQYGDGRLQFSVGPADHTLWYAILKP